MHPSVLYEFQTEDERLRMVEEFAYVPYNHVWPHTVTMDTAPLLGANGSMGIQEHMF